MDCSFPARNGQEREVSLRPLLFQDFTIDSGVLDDLDLNNLVATLWVRGLARFERKRAKNRVEKQNQETVLLR